MSDKANANVRADQIAESIKEAVSHPKEGCSIADFVAGLLPNAKPGDGKTPQNSSGSPAEGRSESQRLPNKIENQSGSDKMHHNENLREYFEKMQLVGPDEKGVIELKTGDTLVRAGGHEILMLKGGGAVVCKPDGSYEVSANAKAKVKFDAQSGTTTLDLGEGQSVTIQNGKITEVTRGGQTSVMMGERLRPWRDDFIKPPIDRIQPYPHPNEKNEQGGGSVQQGIDQLKKIEKNK